MNIPEIEMEKPILKVEVCIKKSKTVNKKTILTHVEEFLKKENSLHADSICNINNLPQSLHDVIKHIKICEVFPYSDAEVFACGDVKLQFFCYSLDDHGPEQETLNEGEENEVQATNEWLLPSSDFDSLWESLIFDTDIKEQLLSFVKTTLLFSDQQVDTKVIAWNKVILLHGPPGTGKTSLCKALAQKLSIRMGDRYTIGQLVEVNSHSLFSKWFSESGKLVQKLFDMLRELLENPKAFVCVLIDEVESLTRTRAAHSGSDPSDALRVVNALLTQLDQIKRYPNVLILTTSNITGAIDLAFVDRADIKQYIGYPSQAAVYQIYRSAIVELMNKNIIVPTEQLLTPRQLKLINMAESQATQSSLLLWSIARESDKFSGRTLRKIPFLAHAGFVNDSETNLDNFLNAMQKAVSKQKDDLTKIDKC